MRKADVLPAFNQSPLTIGRAINISRSAVNQWDEIVPLRSALLIHEIKPDIPLKMEDYGLPDPQKRAKRGVRLDAVA